MTELKPLKSGKKRSVEERDESGTEKLTDAAQTLNISNNKKKRKRAKQINEDFDLSDKKDGIDESIGKMDSRLLADFFAQQAQKHNNELTSVELDDLCIPQQAFANTSSWNQPRNQENLPMFLNKYTPKRDLLSSAPIQNGSPHTLVITEAGIRAAELTRTLRVFQTKECAIAKLFAKHIKLNDAKEYVRKTRMGLGVGTPARINDLVNADCLKLDSLKRIVIDGSHIDQKKRGIFDMKEVYFPLLTFLNRADLKDRYTSTEDKVQILVY